MGMRVELEQTGIVQGNALYESEDGTIRLTVSPTHFAEGQSAPTRVLVVIERPASRRALSSREDSL